MRYEITVEGHFSAAHFLEEYDGLCRSLHGHRWNVKLSAKLARNAETGMVVDFTEMKRMFNYILKDLDHACIIDPNGNEMSKDIYAVLKKHNVRTYEFEGRTTAENLAEHIFYKVQELTGWTTHSVEVFETPTNSVKFSLE